MFLVLWMDNKERNTFIKMLVEIFNKNSLSSLEFKDDKLELNLKKELGSNMVVVPTAQQPVYNTIQQQPIANSSEVQKDAVATITSVDYSNHEGAVKAPTVGIIYLSSSPDKPHFITKGATVKEGDTIFLLEVMKVFNPIKAHKDGIVKEILVKDSHVVEYNEVLAIIE